MTFDTRAPLSIQSARTINVGRGSGGNLKFNPLYIQNYSAAAVGTTPTEGWNLSEIVEAPALTNNRSARLGRNLALGNPIDPENCGGALFGARIPMNLVTVGHTVWQKYKMYIPETFSWGYAYSNGETDNPCSRPTDGFGQTKWLVFSPDVGTARIYTNLEINQKRAVDPSPNPRIAIIIENGSQVAYENLYLPFDRWFSIQMAVKVSNSGVGFVRAWIDDQLVIEFLNVSTISASANGLNEFGIGDYWNGVPWSDGLGGRDSIYVDEIIVATDMPGYGAPSATDEFGNLLIPDNIMVEDLT